MKIIDAAEAMFRLERVVAAVKGEEVQGSKFSKALATLKTLSRKEGIPLAIVGGLAAIHYGYSFTVTRMSLKSGRSLFSTTVIVGSKAARFFSTVRRAWWSRTAPG